MKFPVARLLILSLTLSGCQIASKDAERIERDVEQIDLLRGEVAYVDPVSRDLGG